MTHRELMLQTLVKFTGQPTAHIETILARWIEQHPGDWDRELPTAQRQEMQAALEKESAGILAWYVRLFPGNESLLEDRAKHLRKQNAANSGTG